MSKLFAVAPGQLEWRDEPDVTFAAPTDAIVRLLTVARCDIDPGVIAGGLPLPLEIGHEFVAEIVELGEQVTHLRVGDRVSSSFAISCGHCSHCSRTDYQSCRSVDLPAMFGFGVYGHSWGGALCDRLRIPFANHMLVKIPDQVSNIAAASAGDNLDDSYRAVVPHLKIKPGSRVCVVGGASSSIGLFAAAWAVWGNASEVAYWDADPRRLQLAEKLGAQVYERSEPDPGRHYDIGHNASGTANSLVALIRAMDYSGQVTSSYIADTTIELNYMELFTPGIHLTIGDQNTSAHIPNVLAALASGFDPTAIIADVVPWADAADAFLETLPKMVVSRS